MSVELQRGTQHLGIKVEKGQTVVAKLQQRGSLAWRKSTASAEGGCVEVARAAGMILVRDSKDPSGPALTFTETEWEAFLMGARAGEFEI